MIPWDWIASCGALLSVWLYGNKSMWAPINGLLNQVAWVGLALSADQYGLFVTAFAFTFVHIRNLLKWIKEKP